MVKSCFGRDDADDCDDLDECDGNSPDQEETATPAGPVVDWQSLPVEAAGAASEASRMGHFLALRLAFGTASARGLAQASGGR